MNTRLLGTIGLTVLAVLVWWAGRMGSEAVEATERRELSRYRVESLPEELPAAWRRQLEETLAAAPEVVLLGEDALAVAEQQLRQLAWIDPASIEARLRLPDGIELGFEPRPLGVTVMDRGRAVAVALDGTVLPDGLSADHLRFLARVPAERPDSLPAVGRRTSDPLVQEALRAVVEFSAVRELLGGDLIAIERQPGYPRDAPGVPPAIAFVTRSGCRLHWGRAAVSRDPGGVPADLKLVRLEAVQRQYPGLAGIAHLVLDAPRVQLVAPDGSSLPLPDPLR
jgi:hypothetical protein